MGRTNPYRHPLGRICGKHLPVAALLTLVALLRHGRECWKEAGNVQR